MSTCECLIKYSKILKDKIVKLGALNMIGLLFQVIIFVMSIVTVVFLRLYSQDYKFTETDLYLLVYLPLVLSYRVTLMLVFYDCCLVLFCILLIPYILCCLCCCDEWVCNVLADSSLSKRLRGYVFFVTFKFAQGRLEFLDVFACLKPCSPKCIDCLQPCLDILGIILDVVFIPGTVVMEFFLRRQLINGGNITPMVLMFCFSTPLIGALVIHCMRLKRNSKVNPRARHIFEPDIKFMEDKVERIMLGNSIASKECNSKAKCFNTDPSHRVTYHKQEDVFKLPQFDPYGRGNTVVGFHLTKIDSVESIVRTEMKPSKTGWLGKGIYFANNMKATFRKSQNPG